LLLDVGGVGYDLHIPLSTYYEIQKLGTGSEVRLHVHTHLRDDGIALFGFWTQREKGLFERLLGVGGVGPRLARVILSGIAPRDLVAALVAGDTARLGTIPGVGRKTAQRLVLELGDKVGDLVEGDIEPPAPGDEDLVLALVNLGYRRALAERAVAASRTENPDAPFADLLRSSLRRLARL
jgi:Holliday junction DNA helicase RuvA